jgi:hypothetical protein
MLLETRGLRTVRPLSRMYYNIADKRYEVWWEDVCEDALTSKGLNTQLRVIGGGARNAQDKVCQIIR